MILLEESLVNFLYYIKQVKSAAELLYENTSVLTADHESLFTELCGTNRELADLELNVAKIRGAFYKLLPLAYMKEQDQ